MAYNDNTYDVNLWRNRKVTKLNDAWTVEGRPRFSYKLLRIETPPNIPGMSLVAVLITAPPKAATPPHSHNGAALYGQVVKGRIINQMIHTRAETRADGTVENVEHDSGVGVYGPGEMWYEAPGCHHVRAENAGDEEAQFFANFVIETEKLKSVDNPAHALTILDIENEEFQRLT